MSDTVLDRLVSNPKLHKLNASGLDVFLQRDFLSERCCAQLIKMIDDRVNRSMLLGNNPDKPDNKFRTSDTHEFDPRDKFIETIDYLFRRVTGLPKANGEDLQGQRYRRGQQFKAHYDGLWGEHLVDPMHGAGGQRTWTLMVFLNEPTAGGKTFFPNAGVRVTPRTGNLLLWNGLLDDGSINPNSLHQGEPVEKGVKYVLTKWYREHDRQLGLTREVFANSAKDNNCPSAL